MLQEIQLALRALYHSNNPKAQRDADTWLQGILQECDADCALKLLYSELLEEQFFAAKILVQKSHGAKMDSKISPVLQSSALENLDILLAKELRYSPVIEKLCEALAALLLRQTAEGSTHSPLDWRTFLPGWFGGHNFVMPVDLLSCLVIEQLPREFQLSRHWMDNEPLHCRMYRSLQRTVKPVIHKATQLVQTCLADDSESLVWPRAMFLQAAAKVMRSWLSFAESFTWDAIIEAQIFPLLLQFAALKHMPSLCTEVLGECFTLPGRHIGDAETQVITHLLQVADECLKIGDPELLHSMTGLLATCAETTVELTDSHLPTAMAEGFHSARKLLDQPIERSGVHAASKSKELSLAICGCLLRYTSHPEKAISSSTFGTWCRIQDGLLHPLGPPHAALFLALLETLLRQSQVDPPASIVEMEMSDELEMHRQGLQEPLRGCFLLLLEDYYRVLLRAWPTEEPPGPQRLVRCESVLFALWAVHSHKVDVSHIAVQQLLRNACSEATCGLPIKTLLEVMKAYPEAAASSPDLLQMWLEFIFRCLGEPSVMSLAATALQDVTAQPLPRVEQLWPVFHRLVVDPVGGVWVLQDPAVQASVLKSFANVACQLPSEAQLGSALQVLSTPLFSVLHRADIAAVLHTLECLAGILGALEEVRPCDAVGNLLEHSMQALIFSIGAVPSAGRQDTAAVACHALQPLLVAACKNYPQLVGTGFQLLCGIYDVAATPLCFSICGSLLQAEQVDMHQDAAATLLLQLLGRGLAALAASDQNADFFIDTAPVLFALMSDGCHCQPGVIYSSTEVVRSIFVAATQAILANTPQVTRVLQQFFGVFLQPNATSHQIILQEVPKDVLVAFFKVLLQQTQLEVNKRGSTLTQGSRGAQLALILQLFTTLQPFMARAALPLAAQDFLPPDCWLSVCTVFERQSEAKFRTRLADLLAAKMAVAEDSL
eukprot:GGOE01043695.1.p1 GENE.GGOE01043695.1~~GGOE01043695.1.p1  ORF type:complete len:946 (-),score=172.47 GGOE01043695.1:85-2922(-)